MLYLALLSFNLLIEKDPSASIKPDIQQGVYIQINSVNPSR